MESRSEEPVLTLGELASATGVPVATVKYYLREGLLPAGRLRSATRADYGSTHLERLRLLRLLREVGDVPVERLRAMVTALDQYTEPDTGSVVDRLGALAAGAQTLNAPVPTPGPHAERAEHLAADLVARGGWTRCPEGAPERGALRAVLETVITWEEVGLPVSAEDLAPYVAAADLVGRHDIASLRETGVEELLTQLVVGQVVYGRLLGVLRSLAEAHHSAVRWGAPDH